MYSPTLRVLAVLELLQNHHEISGPELAQRLEVDVRTVRRYITNLQDMGIPVESQRGPCGAYRLSRGKRMPPLMFNSSEAVSIALGLRVIRELEFPLDPQTLEATQAKLERVLQEPVSQHLRGLHRTVQFLNTGMAPVPKARPGNFISVLSSAAQNLQQVHLRYETDQQSVTERDFDPYGAVYNQGYWYTAGYCHLRNAFRTFRVDRILSLQPLNRSYQKNEEFDLLEHVQTSIRFSTKAHQIKIRLKTDLESARELVHPMIGTVQATESGPILVSEASDFMWIAHFLLELDISVEIQEPPSLIMFIKSLRSKVDSIVENSEIGSIKN